ncbi:MAG TPA: cellulose binding domain-containing protein, partial [Bacillota bacterium]|nr:cellulose binding domain-containing protein [Bacillota bacterium]HOL10553.1 cellulose binding domain-containing protein [Bacillota bacterium]HPO98255.1 cellulose binding domain-containing protein [Bacillota bacterium]
MKFITKLTFCLLIIGILTLSTLSLFAAAPALRVQMYNGNRASEINTVFPWFKLTNTGSEVIDLSKVKLRYFYTIDGEKPQNFWCDWSSAGNGNVTGTFVKLEPAQSNADYYLEIGFKSAAGQLKPGQSVELHCRFAKQDWSNFNQLNDYSFNPIATTYVDWDRVEVIIAGTKPTTSHDFQADGIWVNQPVTIRLTADNGQATTYYQINQGAKNTGNLIQLNEEGIYDISYWSEDGSGNNETPKTVTVKIDQTAPVISAQLNPAANEFGWNNSNVRITFEALDMLSGVKDVTPEITLITEGAKQTVTGTATDNAGNTSTKTVTLNIDKTLPLVTIIQPADGTIVSDRKLEIVAELTDNLSGINPNSIQLILDGKTITGTYNPDTNRLTYTPVAEYSAGSHTITVTANDRAGNQGLTAKSTFTVKGEETNLPPDPATVAPELDPTIVSDMKTATGFLYSGPNPIQTGIDPETIEPHRAAVIRGRVLDRNNQPLPGVKITILNHPEYGQTISRADGMFDLAVNGGGYLTVNYEKSGYLSAQRQVDVPWQDYAVVADVVLITSDPVVTPIKMNATETQVARGSLITDKDGTRQATIIFPEGIKAKGTNQTTLNIRATEYTVGDNGPAAMPAQLPPQIAYTYCVELAADGFETVEFNKPVYFYLENFLNFPVGSAVPVGYYDRAKGVWIASDNGIIVKILRITDGKAVLDINGQGVAATTAELEQLGVSAGELEQLAAMYQPGQSLWRVPMTHFTPWDCNWPFGPPMGALGPMLQKPKEGNCQDQNCPEDNSIIQVQSQVLG